MKCVCPLLAGSGQNWQQSPCREKTDGVCSTEDNYRQTLGRERGREEGAGRARFDRLGSAVYLSSPV